MKRLQFSVVIFSILACSCIVRAQQVWNSRIQTQMTVSQTNGYSIVTSYFDGAGTHLLMQGSTDIFYALLNSSGGIVRSHTFSTNGAYPNITGAFGKIYAVYYSENYIYVGLSTDEGADWSITTIPSLEVGTNCDGVVAVADPYNSSLGLHVSWSTENSSGTYNTYYEEWVPGTSGGWKNYKTVSDYGTDQGGEPSMAVSPGRVDISFIGDILSNGYGDVVYTRDYDLATGTWGNTETIASAYTAKIYSNGSTVHIIYATGGATINGGRPAWPLYDTYRAANGTSWSTPTKFGLDTWASPETGTAFVSSNGDLNLLYTYYGTVYVDFNGTSWSNPQYVDDPSTDIAVSFSISGKGKDLAVTWLDEGMYPAPDDLFYRDNFWDVSGTVASNSTWDGVYNVTGNLTINSGVTLTIEPGSHVELSSGVTIIGRGTLNAEGTSTSPIHFEQATPGSPWGDIFLSGNNNQFSYCTFDGGTNDVYLYESGGNAFNECTFENASGVGLYFESGAISDFTKNAIEDNGSYGIEVEGGTLYMGYGTDSYPIGGNPNSPNSTAGAGDNKVTGNCTSSGGAQIYVDTNGRLYVGSVSGSSSSGYSLQDGFNSITSARTLYIYNLAMTLANETEEQWEVPAQETYWGGSVGSEDFYGTVNYTYQLMTDPSGGAGAATLRVSIDHTPATLMTAAMASNVFKSAPDAAKGQFFVNLKNRMMQVINDINNPKMDMTHPRMIGLLNSLASFDTNNVTQERGTVQALLRSYYKELPGGNFSDATSRLCSEAALVAEVQNEVNSEKPDSAEGLMNEYGKYVQNNDNQRTLLFNQMEIDQQHKQDVEALGVLKRIEAFKPDSKQKKGFEAPDYTVIASALSQGVSNASQAKEVASVQTQKVPTKFALLQNYPNPFNPTTTIDYDLAAPANVRLIVYDVTGQEVAVLENGYESAGAYHAVFNGSRFASGVYFVRLITQGQNGRQYIKTMKMMMLK